MFNYKFPHIKSFSDVKNIATSSDDFFVKFDQENGLIIVNYRLNTPDTFPDLIDENDYENAVKREFRGLKFCIKTDKIIGRPFHKFFNLNERESCSIQNIDFTKPHVVLDKLDGSMIHPVLNHKGDILWCTKMGPTEVSQKVLPLVNSQKKYVDLAKWCFEQGEMGWTPIFEFTSRNQKIVIDYGPEDNLTLLAIRDNVTGEYISY